MPACYVNFANGWSKEVPSTFSSTRFWSCVSNVGGGSARERQRTDSTHVLAKIRAINRLMGVGEAVRFALNSLAIVAPDWLLSFSEAQWVERYGHRIEESHLPKSEGDRLALAEQIGADGRKLLTAVFDALAPGDSCSPGPASDLDPKRLR